MKRTEIEKLNQLVSRTDMTGNEKVEWLTNFIDKREQQLRIADVIVPKGTLSCGCKDHLIITFTKDGDYCGNCGKIILTT